MKKLAPSTSELIEWRRPRQALKGVSALTHLYNRMDGAYPGKFCAAFPSTASVDNWKDAWEEAFLRDGITPHEVALALDRMKGNWPPSLPEFLVLCRAPIDPEEAFYAAVDEMQARQGGEIGNWPHPAIYWAAVRIVQHDLLAAGYDALKGRWENALRDVKSKGRWEAIPKPALALAALNRSQTSDAEARQQLATSSAAVADVIKPVPRQACGRDLRWARRILEQDQQPTGRPPAINVQVAELALRAAGEGAH